MTTLDSALIPVIFTDKNGCITYKNQAAKRCIPSPRTGGNMNKYIKTTYISGTKIENIGIQFIENEKSIFKSAFILKQEKIDIWIFPAEFQLSEPEDISEISKNSLNNLADGMSNLIFDCRTDSVDLPSPMRYQRMEEELLKALKQINPDKNASPFRISDILDSLSEMTQKLSASLNFRVRFNFNIRDSKMGYRIKFAPFAMIYTYILIFMLSRSKNCECCIDAFRIGDVVKFTFRTVIDKTDTVSSDNNDFSYLASLFPKDQINLMLINQTAALSGFKINWSLSASSELALNVTVSLNNTSGSFLFQPLPAAVVSREFRRKNKLVLEYLESAFMQYKKR